MPVKKQKPDTAAIKRDMLTLGKNAQDLTKVAGKDKSSGANLARRVAKLSRDEISVQGSKLANARKKGK